jgi:hypothetical protein
LSACLFAANVCAETWLLRGTVGKYPVVMELDEPAGEVDGRYFYEKYKQDIPLRGSREGESWRLTRHFFRAKTIFAKEA